MNYFSVSQCKKDIQAKEIKIDELLRIGCMILESKKISKLYIYFFLKGSREFEFCPTENSAGNLLISKGEIKYIISIMEEIKKLKEEISFWKNFLNGIIEEDVF